MFFPSLITIVPALGVMTSNLRMLASLSRVNRIRETRKLDGFNPIPPVWGVLNCIAWLLFAFITKGNKNQAAILNDCLVRPMSNSIL